ncbi:MAG: 30S ribosomal protein S9 [Deltaproteobacteria bacterium]
MVEEVFSEVGRRKTSVARVRLSAGSGVLTVNKKTADDYFKRPSLGITARQPLELTNSSSKYDVSATVAGGGATGQAEAVRHGIARALVSADQNLRAPLKKAGFLTRDPRMKERKKYGQKGARKRFQFSKR